MQRMIALTVTILVIAAGCGSRALPAAQGSTAATPSVVASLSPIITPTPTPTPTATPSPTPAASPAAVDPTPTASRGAMVIGDPVAIPNMRDLVWASTLIVHGTITEKLPSQRFPAVDGPLGTMTPQNYYDMHIYTDYVIAVDQVFRGNPTDRVTLRQVGGRVGDTELVSANSPELHPGDDLVLFLTPDYPDRPGDAFWPTGAEQGIWLPEGDEYAPYHGLIGPLAQAGIGQAVADALNQGPPEFPPLKLVSLEESPPGPDLP
ncbi:MAG TPA: hypothetical protein VF201_02030 [Nitrolancea sp.]